MIPELMPDSGGETIDKQRAIVKQKVATLSTDSELFKRVYKHTFVCSREPDQRALSLGDAITYWEILFSAPGIPWVSANTEWLKVWVEFLNAKWKKSVNKDMWNQTHEFFVKTMEDESMSFWSEDSAWPSVIDDFVAYVRDKRGDTGEKMEMD